MYGFFGQGLGRRERAGTPVAAWMLAAGCAALTGCAAGSPGANCTGGFAVSVSPASATATAGAMPPGNQVQFVGTARATAPPGCPVPALVQLEYAAWTNPDPKDIQISSANDNSNGVAVCTGPTAGPVTLTGVFAPITLTGPAGGGADGLTSSVQLTCQ